MLYFFKKNIIISCGRESLQCLVKINFKSDLNFKSSRMHLANYIVELQ